MLTNIICRTFTFAVLIHVIRCDNNFNHMPMMSHVQHTIMLKIILLFLRNKSIFIFAFLFFIKISLVLEFQRWWVLKSKILAKNQHIEKILFLNPLMNYGFSKSAKIALSKSKIKGFFSKKIHLRMLI